MNNILFLFTSIIIGVFSQYNPENSLQEEGTTTYYLIRHAEKDRSDASNKNPDLTEEGLKRAEKWAEVLKDVKFDLVYSTDYNRTLQTATPLARQNSLEIQKYDPRNLYDESFKKVTSGKTVLVVGHSNTTPQFVNAILGKPEYQDLPDDENGALFIVHVSPEGKAKSEILYIN